FAVQCPTIMLSLARLFQIAFMVTLTLPAAAQAPTATAQTSPVQAAKQDDAQAIDKWTDFSATNVAFLSGAAWLGGCEKTACGVYRIDPETHKVISAVAMDKPPYSIVAAFGSIWATNPTRDTVTRIDPVKGDVIETIQVGSTPAGLAAGEGAIWVTNLGGKSVSRIDPQSNKVAATIRVANYPEPVVVSDGAVWVGNAEACWGCVGSISRIDPRTNSVTKSIKTWKYGTEVHPTAMVAQSGILWVMAGEHVLRIDTSANKIVKWIGIPQKRLFSMPEGLARPGRFGGLAVSGGEVYVADAQIHGLWKIDASSNQLSPEPRALNFPPSILAVSPDGNLWVSDDADRVLMQIKP
ncbi:MAG TPA: YncE family protein, partial [Terriglobales bacterium]|nr:YncE family protein [Terriglobales bacterium]